MFSKINARKILTFFIILITSTPMLLSSNANAAKGYRYWGYFQAAPDTTQWIPAMTGPTTTLQDGAVEGWSFRASVGGLYITLNLSPAEFNTFTEAWEDVAPSLTWQTISATLTWQNATGVIS